MALKNWKSLDNVKEVFECQKLIKIQSCQRLD